jgi:hypothetical protein
MSPGHDFTTLRQIPPARVQVTVLKTGKTKTSTSWTLQYTNVSGQLAFFLNPQIIKEGQEVLPSYWSDNYFSIPAGKKVVVTVDCPANALDGAPLQLRLEGWNITLKTINI